MAILLVSVLVGLCIGSFLNVVIYRLPIMLERQWREESKAFIEEPESPSLADIPETFNLSLPASGCPNCGHKIRPWENIPVLSFLLLRGKCSGCDTRISWRYPLIELTTGFLTLLIFVNSNTLMTALFGAVFTWVLVALTLIDWDTQLLPDNLTLPLLWLGLLVNSIGVFVPPQEAILGAALGYGILWTVYWLFKLATGKEGMGYGDFKLLAALGAWMGIAAVPMIILMSALVGTIVGLVMMASKKLAQGQAMAFGPYLAMAGWITFIWQADISQWYFSIIGLN